MGMVIGGYIKAEIQAVADHVQIGEVIEYKVPASVKMENPIIKRKGRVIGKYPSFVLMDNGKYREAVNWIDFL